MIRLATAADAAAVRGLVHDAYGRYVARLGKPPGPMTVEYVPLIAAGRMHLLEIDGQLTGLAVLSEEPDALHLDNVAVLPAAHGRGHGRTLIAFAEAEAIRRGFRELRLGTNEHMTENIAIYRHLGFVETGRVPGKSGFTRVLFAKALPDPAVSGG